MRSHSHCCSGHCIHWWPLGPHRPLVVFAEGAAVVAAVAEDGDGSVNNRCYDSPSSQDVVSAAGAEQESVVDTATVDTPPVVDCASCCDVGLDAPLAVVAARILVLPLLLAMPVAVDILLSVACE